jgi:peptidoglycan/xylan/chitin deacetylase (PgdA/CDA1 family)
MISRRQFTQTLLAFGLSSLMPRHLLASAENAITVPPSVMLHSRHWRILPDLLVRLRDLGYSGVTYRDWEQAIIGHTTLPEQPVILSVDDVTAVQGSPAFAYFERMKDNFLEAGFGAVFGVITRPDLPQDTERWGRLSAWAGEGIELATHTAHHSNLDNPSWLVEDYESEIVESAAVIAERTGQPVRTLITPYGSGYDIEHRSINPQVLSACRQANLRFLVGISTGQRHVHQDNEAGDVLYVGRANPGDEYTVNDALYYVQYW